MAIVVTNYNKTTYAATPTTQKAASQPAASAATTGLPPHFLRKSTTGPDGFPRDFVIFVPKQYRADQDKKWPVLIFLHGSGERGRNTLQATAVGIGPYIAAKRMNDFPFITIFPQVSGMWFRGKQEDFVWRTLETVQKDYKTDPDRIYLTGLSMGGFGTWELAMHHPDRLAAIVPVCGGYDDMSLSINLAGLPIHAFHGRLDTNVPPSMDRAMIEVLRRHNPKPLYTEFFDQNHFCWDKVYSNDDLYNWLLQQKRRDKPKQFTIRYPDHSIPLPWRAWWVRMDEVANNSRQPTIQVDVSDDGTIALASESVERITLFADAMPIALKKPITIMWNGQQVFQGPLEQDIVLKFPVGN